VAATAEELREAGTPTTEATRIAVLRLHPDVRVRVLCARHPNLPPEAFADLARDPVVSVRRAIAGHHGLPTAVAAALMADTDRLVRRIARRSQPMSSAAVLALLTGGHGSPDLLARAKELALTDPDFAESLFKDWRWRRLAAQGAFHHRFVRQVIKENQTHALVPLATAATLSVRSKLALARISGRPAQEAVASRSDLRLVEKLLILTVGGIWAVAARLKAEPTSRAARTIAVIRRHHVIRRARAESTSNRFVLWRLSFVKRYDMGMAIAGNPRVGRRTIDRLAGYHPWAASAVLAARTDIPVDMLAKLSLHPQVQLLLAVNPNTTPAMLRRMVASSDPFVKSMASVHPNRPAAEKQRLAEDGDAPAWLLRHLANDVSMPQADRDRMLTWLALGGGNGDVNFDPITCMGSPGNAGETHEQAYRRLARDRNEFVSLWRSRAFVGIGAGSLPLSTIASLAADWRPEVRRVAATYRSKVTVDQLWQDPAPMVSSQALATIASAGPKGLARPKLRGRGRQSLWWLVWPAVVIGLNVASSHDSSTTTPPFTPVYPAGGVPIATFPTSFGVPLGAWSPGLGSRPQTKPVCVAGGNTVWVEATTSSIVVTVGSDAGALVALAINESPDSAARRSVITVGAGEARTFVQPMDAIGRLNVAIGDASDHPMMIPLDLVTTAAITVLDPGGDC